MNVLSIEPAVHSGKKRFAGESTPHCVRGWILRYCTKLSQSQAAGRIPREPVKAGVALGMHSGCSVTWLARLHGVQKVAGSNPVTPTERKPQVGNSLRLFSRPRRKEPLGNQAINAGHRTPPPCSAPRRRE